MTQDQTESGGLVLVAYAEPQKSAAAPREEEERVYIVQGACELGLCSLLLLLLLLHLVLLVNSPSKFIDVRYRTLT